MRAVALARVNRVLGVLLALVLLATVASVLLVPDGGDRLRAAATPWGADRDLAERHREVAAAAEELTLAFLHVDHRDMDPLVEAVLDGATGEFRKQYAENRDKLVRDARRNRSRSTGEVVALGVADLEDDSAEVLVAANSLVANKRTAGAEQPRYYRLRLSLVREGDRWLASDLEFVR